MEIHHFCPRCGAPEISFGTSILDASGDVSASCSVCGWSGAGKDTLGTVTSEKLWTADRVLSFLYLASLRNVGGVIQSLEMIGLVPTLLSGPTEAVPAGRVSEYNQAVEECRTRVLRESLEAFIVTMIASAEQANKKFSAETGVPLPRMFSSEPSAAS